MATQKEIEQTELIGEMKSRLQMQDAVIKKLMKPPYTRATVIRVFKKTVLLAGNGSGVIEVSKPRKVKGLTRPLKPGDIVRLNAQAAIVAYAADEGLAHGVILKVIAVRGEQVEVGRGEISDGGGVIIWRGDVAVEPGDRVKLDPGSLVVVENLGKPPKKTYTYEQTTGVTWDSIGGQDEAKAHLREAIELPYSHPEIFKRYGKRPAKGVLLYGPPGCGKTMLAKAAASSLAAAHKVEAAESGFIYVKGPEILSKWVGESEATIRELFQTARDHMEKAGYPAILFVDEAEAIMAARGTSHTSGMDRTIVPMFLAEMDGFDVRNPLVLLATNRADQLDPAITRDGRIDRKVQVLRPNREDTKAIFTMYLHDKPISDHELEAMAMRCTEELLSPERVLYEVNLKGGGVENFTLGHMVSGAMIAGVVDVMSSFALHRELAGEGEPGLNAHDMLAAVDSIENQNRGLNHHQDLARFQESIGREVTGVRAIAA